MELNELRQLMRSAGMVGDGGAGFPSYAKLAEGADTLIINGSECEPLLYTDYTILKREMATVLFGIEQILDTLHIPRALLSVKEHTAQRLGIADGTMLARGVYLKVTPNVYPVGDEVILIYQTTGRVVRPGQLPISERVIVYNVETMYNLGRLIKHGEPVTSKWLTVGGDVPSPTVVRVPVGARIDELLAKLGIRVRDDQIVIDGGPSMGKIINLATAEVGKTTKAILVLPADCNAAKSKLISDSMATARAETACCQCTRCTDMCPRNLIGYPLEPHRMVRTAMGAAALEPRMVIAATLCCGCGVCETLACSQGISPRAVIAGYKVLLGKNGLKYVSSEGVTARPERDYRMIKTERWAQSLGVSRFDRVAEYGGKLLDFERVEIPLGRYIGALGIPVVKDGDRVKVGQLVSRATEGLSVPHHASIDGVVTVSDTEILVERE